MKDTEKVNEFLKCFFEEYDVHTNIKTDTRHLVCDQILRIIDDYDYDYDLIKSQITSLNSRMIEFCRRYEKRETTNSFFKEIGNIASFIITCGEANKRLERDDKEFQAILSRLQQD